MIPDSFSRFIQNIIIENGRLKVLLAIQTCWSLWLSVELLREISKKEKKTEKGA